MAQRYYVMMAAIVVAWVCLRYGVVAANQCRDTASCCHTFNFELGPEFNMATYGPLNSSMWAAQGIELHLEENGVFGLLNLSKTAGSAIVGASDLASPTEGMALAAFASYPTTLLRRIHTMHWRLAKQSACIGRVRISRTLPFAIRQSVILSTGRYAVPGMPESAVSTVQTQTFSWSSSDQQNWNEYEFSSTHVDELKVYFYGAGYGTVDSVEVCYAAPLGIDACGVCAGNGDTCVVEGAACNTGMAGICAAGTVDADLQCIANRAGDIELCDGIDNNCNGQIDEGEWGLVSCGRPNTTCYREVSRCINGTAVDSCVPNPGEPEICGDGIDNDCDGIVDNSPPCPPPPSASSSPSPSGSTSATSSSTTSATPSISTTSSATPSTNPSATSSTSLSPSTSGSVTPSPVPATPQPTPSASPLPRDGSGYLVPVLGCVRQLGSPEIYQAVFGYVYMGRSVDAVLGVDATSNILQSSDSERLSIEQTQTTYFKAWTAQQTAFTATFGPNEELQWSVHFNATNVTATSRQTATANRYSPRCTDSGVPSLMEPVQPRLDRCVLQVASAECTASFGYYNPNQQTVQLDIGSGRNEFVATNTVGPQVADRRQPRVFWPGTVGGSVSVKFDCSHTAWSLCWSLSTMGTVQSACVDQSNVC